MRERLQARLGELKKELETGRIRLQGLEKRQLYLREMMLRISGAIQVLEELLAEEHLIEQNGAHSGEEEPLSGRVNPDSKIQPGLQASDLEEHNHRSIQNSSAVDTLEKKE